MAKCSIRIALILFIMSNMQAHVAVIQSFAWAHMMVTYSQTNRFQTAIKKTFDGQHPCAICLKLKKATPSGQSLAASETKSQTDGALLAQTILVGRLDRDWILPFSFAKLSEFSSLPPSPPPKAFNA